MAEQSPESRDAAEAALSAVEEALSLGGDDLLADTSAREAEGAEQATESVNRAVERVVEAAREHHQKTNGKVSNDSRRRPAPGRRKPLQTMPVQPMTIARR